VDGSARREIAVRSTLDPIPGARRRRRSLRRTRRAPRGGGPRSRPRPSVAACAFGPKIALVVAKRARTQPSRASGRSSFVETFFARRLDPSYPRRFQALRDAPAVVEAHGPLSMHLDRLPHAIAIVGTRRATQLGMRHARWLAGVLAERGVTVVSGGAGGIDAHAHVGAIENGGRTVVVLPTGIDVRPSDGRAHLFEDRRAERGARLRRRARSRVNRKRKRETGSERREASPASLSRMML